MNRKKNPIETNDKTALERMTDKEFIEAIKTPGWGNALSVEDRIRILKSKRKILKAKFLEGGKLLQNFQNSKCINYIEPKRMGTKKGDIIGFSEPKHRATVFLIRKDNLKNIAQLLDISYGLLRKWRWEKTFDEMVIKHCEEFSNIVINRLRERVEQREKHLDDFLKEPINKIVKSKKSPLLSLSYGEFEVSSYSDILLFIVGRELKRLLDAFLKKDIKEFALFLECKNIFDFVQLEKLNRMPLKEKKKLETSESKKLENKINEEDGLLRKRAKNTLLDNAIRCLTKPKLTEKSKKEIIATLLCVKEPLDELAGEQK